MQRALTILPVLLLYMQFEVGAQEITVAQSQYILARAKSKVKTYTEYLELLAKTNASDIETREFYKQTMYLSFAKEGGKTRVYNDLIPHLLAGRVPGEENPQLETYLNKIAEYYGDSLLLTFRNPEASDVYYAANENWYFVKITVDRKGSGIFRFGNERIGNDIDDQTDFYVNAYLVGGQPKIGGIYSIQPHTSKEFTKAKIVGGGDQQTPLLIGQPLKFQAGTIFKKFKRNREYVVKWDGGLADDIVRLELVPKDTSKHKTKVFAPMLNSNSLSFVPTKAEKVGDYKFRLHNVSTGRYTQSGEFMIARKVPLGVSVGGGLLVGGAIAYYISTLGDGEDEIEDPFEP
ncbi:hypothetical protein WBG78_14255 [Chryseolinea sp. T2]|uniref:hypothetical protein n=1 Tax=Chryseolinea sp. T2 TaxID=3129255 RepID=UPI0030781562